MSEQITLQESDKDLPKHVQNGFMRYSNFKPLTQGGEAILQTCRDENLGRTVVMKTLLPQLQNLETYQKRFLREARVTALIPHPATVPVYELSRDREGNAYFTMKKLSGRDLCDILDAIAENHSQSQTEFPLSRMLEILIQVGNCLAYAHSLGVVHRDLKPSNVMVGEYGDITLLDWGLAKVWDMDDNDEVEQLARSGRQQISGRLTGKGDVQGTPFYMSPEQARETGDVDERTDIYNMGILLFEVLTGDSYMSGRNFKEIKRKILEDPVREPKSVAKHPVPPELNAVCVKALQKNPADRYPTMLAMVDDFKAFLQNEPVSVYRAPLPTRLLKPASQRAFTSNSAIWLLTGVALTVVAQLVLRQF
ncbi:MAG: serine/threonine-protein kinase [Planctomycetaceae bacterium]